MIVTYDRDGVKAEGLPTHGSNRDFKRRKHSIDEISQGMTIKHTHGIRWDICNYAYQ